MRIIRFLLLTTIVSTLLLSVPTRAHAYLIDELEDLQNDIDTGEEHLHTWEYNMIDGALKNVALGLVGVPGASDDVEGRTTSSGGLGGLLCGIMSSTLESPPTVQPVQHLAKMLRLRVSPVYANTGSQLLTDYNFEGLWKICRNVSYVLLIAVLVAVGFMVMFGAKVDPRTTVTVQMALPRIVTTLLLITFSYAIGGLFIDLVALLKAVFGNLFGINWGDLGNLFGDIAFGIAGVPIIPGMTRPGMIDQIPGLDTTLGSAVKGLGKPLFFVTVLFMAIIALINVFIAFLGEWANLFIRTAFSPIFILGDALPRQSSREMPAYSWFKALLASSISIPIMGLLLWFAQEFAKEIPTFGIQGPGFITPPAPINAIVAFGILLLITSIPAAVKNALGVLPPSGVAGAAQKSGELMKTASLLNPVKIKIP